MRVCGTALGVVLALATTGCAEQATAPTPIEVVVAPAEQRDFPIYGRYVATTRASLDVQVRARVEGFLEERAFTEGSLVREGDLLYRIDDRPYRARVARLEARLQSAQAAFAKAQRDVARLRPLYEEDAASQLDLDNAVAAEQSADADVSAAAAELEEARLELEYTQVRAPISGLVGASKVDIGALVGPGGDSLLTTIKQTDPMYVQFHMSSLDYLNARRSKNTWLERRQADQSGTTVEGNVQLTLPDDSIYRYPGDIDFSDPQVDLATGTFDVRATVINPDRELLPGQYTRATLELDVIPNAVIVDERVIQIEQGGSYLMIAMPDNTVERRFVVPAAHHGGETVIGSGLEAGELVVVEGMHKVQHGQAITPLTRAEYEQRLEQIAASDTAAEAP